MAEDIGPSEDQINDWNIHNDHMDDYNDVVVDGWPCEHCGAEAGEPCKPACSYVYAADEAQADEQVPLLEQAQGALTAVAYRLPYSGLLDDPPSRKGIEHDVWLAKLAVWLEGYRALLTEQVAQLEADARRGIALQLEKDVVRGFLTGTGGAA